jgi:predicted amidohydrolase YtcJ
MSANKTNFTRRDFLKASAVTLGGAALASCGKGEQAVQLAATIIPPPAVMPPPSMSAGEFADTILVNGNLITMDTNLPSAQALAIKNGRILQLGTDDTIRGLAGESTQVIDLSGKTATPGLIDAHNHLQVWSNMLQNFTPLIPPEVKTLDDLLARFKDVVANAKAGDWVQGYFWVIDPLPTRSELYPISPDNPVWILQQGGHYGCTNSKGLEIAGITRDTKDPEGSVIARDEDGEPTGVLYNHKAMDLLRAYAPQPTIEDYIQGMRYSEELMAAGGGDHLS